jgi:N-acetylmuramoyl-L-alanine amidase
MFIKNITRTICIMLVLISIIPTTMFADTGNAIQYSDIQNHWAKKYIDYLANKQLIKGKTDTTFEPDQSLTRAEFTTLVVKAMNVSSTTVTNQTYFHDVNSNDWFYPSVIEATKAGIISGYEDGTFQPDKEITRKELAKILVKAVVYCNVSLNIGNNGVQQILSQYKDLKNLTWGGTEIAEVINAKIMNGLDIGTFGPNELTTRAQASVVIVRFLSLIQ